MSKSAFHFIRGLLISAGVLLWLINWWSGRPLFIDEANVARNLFDRSFADLFVPLDHEQYAPPLYLVLTKACGALFGYSEVSLRLPALFGGLLAIPGLLLGGKALKSGPWGLLSLGLLFVNPLVLRYTGELKPYSFDLGLAALLLGYGYQNFRPGRRWGLIGALVPWLSFPSVFLLATLASRYLYRAFADDREKPWRDLKRWSTTILLWGLSFGVLYFTIIRPSVGSSYLNGYHQAWFFPLPGANDFFYRSLLLSGSFVRLTFGFTALALGLGSLSWLIGLWYARQHRSGWLLFPAGLVILVSAVEHYSLIPRLLLFVLPGGWLLATRASQEIAHKASPAFRWGLVALWIVTLGGSNVARHFSEPAIFSDGRALVQDRDPAYRVLLHPAAVPVFDYYTRIHPARTGAVPLPALRHPDTIGNAGRYVVLYDVLTEARHRTEFQQDSLRGAAAGCAVRAQPRYRAAALYFDCPGGKRSPGPSDE